MAKVVCYFEFYTSLKFFSEYFAIFQNVTIKQFTKFFEHQAPFPEIVLHKSIKPRLVLLFPSAHLFYLSGPKKTFTRYLAVAL